MGEGVWSVGLLLRGMSLGSSRALELGEDSESVCLLHWMPTVSNVLLKSAIGSRLSAMVP